MLGTERRTMSNSSTYPYWTYVPNKVTAACVCVLVSVSLVAWLVQSVQSRFRPFRLSFLLLISHLTILTDLIIRAAAGEEASKLQVRLPNNQHTVSDRSTHDHRQQYRLSDRSSPEEIAFLTRHSHRHDARCAQLWSPHGTSQCAFVQCELNAYELPLADPIGLASTHGHPDLLPGVVLEWNRESDEDTSDDLDHRVQRGVCDRSHIRSHSILTDLL